MMLEFQINKNGKNRFTMTPHDFIQRCDELQVSILEKIGENGSLPDEVDGLDLMMLKEFDEFFECYFTLKFILKRYEINLDDRLQEKSIFIGDLIRLSLKEKGLLESEKINNIL